MKYILFLISFLVVMTYACLLILGVESLLLLITFSDTHTHRRCCQPAASSVHCTTSCKHSLVLLRMGEINARNMLSWLTLLINCYCFICLVVYIIVSMMHGHTNIKKWKHLYKQLTRCNNNNFINNLSQLNMFRALISPILRSTRLCLQLVV